jgi:SAM-dependent methyltransferase
MNYTSLLPRDVKIQIKKIKFFGTKFYCNVCKSHLRYFLGAGVKSELFEKFNIIGGGYSENDNCPVCLSGKRQRLMHMYLSDNNRISSENIKLLHVAPEQALYHFLKRKKNISYYCGDIDPDRYWFCHNITYLDLTNIPYDDESFDFIIASHILEHIPEDLKALSEIQRVLKPGGVALLQVPISWTLKKTYQDKNILTENDRELHFGQKDHVRIYGSDFLDRIAVSGLKVHLIEPTTFSGYKWFNKTNINMREKLIIGVKKMISKY